MRILILIPILSLPGPGSWWRGNWTTGSTWTRTKWDGRPPPSSQVRQQTHSCLFMWRRWQFGHLSLKKRFASSSPLSRQHRLPEWQRSGPNLKDRPCHLRPTTRQLFLYFLVYTKKNKKKWGPERHHGKELRGTEYAVTQVMFDCGASCRPWGIKRSRKSSPTDFDGCT